MEKSHLTDIIVAVISIVLIVLSFFLLRPILMSIIFGFVLVFIFSPVYNLLHKKIKSKNLCATIITLGLIIIIVALLILTVPIIVKEAVNLFTYAQEIDFRAIIQNLFPSLEQSTLAAQIDSTLHVFITDLTTSILNSITTFLGDFPIIILQLTVVLFTFFFVLRDKEDFLEYVRSVLPFPKDIQERLLKATKEVTASVLYGEVIVGLVQGIIAGIGFFLFGVPNPILFTVLAIIAGVLPIVGPTIIWAPLAIYLLITGNNVAALGVSIFGIASGLVDNFLRPVIVAKKLMMNSLLALLGTIGGILLFGVLGFILGPLIIAYLLIFLEVYRNKKFTGLLTKSE